VATQGRTPGTPLSPGSDRCPGLATASVPGVSQPEVVGLLLAAGAGRRMGTPKALLRHPDGEAWVSRSARVLSAGGCARVLVVLGAAAEQARPLVPAGFAVVVADDWDEGMGASLRCGLTALLNQSTLPGRPFRVQAVLVGLVDTPGVSAEVVSRVRAALTGPDALARAAYAGVPGHPVLIGSAHWRAAAQAASGDTGAREYLAGRSVTLVECGDLGSGDDLDLPVGPAR
jgi:CTP:molybdopterin cytidylyltransferase MocA